MKKGILLSALFALILAACEKEEKIAKDDGVVHCPVHWVASYLMGGGSSGCTGYSVNIENETMLLEAEVSGHNSLVLAQCQSKVNLEALPVQDDFEAAVEISPRASLSDNGAFSFRINHPKDSAYFDFASVYRAPHALTVVRQPDGYHFWLDAGYQLSEPFAPIADFHRARLSICRKQVEGRDDIVLTAQVFDKQGKKVAEGQAASPITLGRLVPAFKLHVPTEAMFDGQCHTASWCILRYDYTGGGKQVSDDFRCNTLFQ